MSITTLIIPQKPNLLEVHQNDQTETQKKLEKTNDQIKAIDEEIGKDKVPTTKKRLPNKWSISKKIGRILCITSIGAMAGGGTSILVYKTVAALLAKTSAASMMVGIFGSAGGGAAGTLNAVRSIQDTGDVQLQKCVRKTVIDSSIVGAAVGSVGALGVPLQGREDPVGQIVIHTMNVYVADEKVTNLTQPEGL